MNPRIAVIGGGWSGLAAALTLAQSGLRCTVFEAAKHLGGRARRIETAGVALDNGQHILLGAYAETLRLLRLVHAGEAESSYLVRRRLSIVRPGGLALRAPLLPAPLHLVAALATARGLQLPERWAALRFFGALQGDHFRVPSGLTVAELIADQPAILAEQLWAPLCIAALNTPMQEASAQVFANVLRAALAGARTASDLLIPRCDLAALFPEPALRFLERRGSEVRTGAVIAAVTTHEAGGFELEVRGEREHFADVICAVAPQHFSRLTSAVPTLLPLRNIVNNFDYEPIATVYLRYDDAPRLPEPMLQLNGIPGQWLFDRGALDGTAGLYAVVISAARLARGLEQDALTAEVIAQLRGLWPHASAPRWNKAIVEKRATFACTPELVRPEAGRIMRGFYLAGDYADPEFPGTIEAAVRSGVRAANALRADRC